MHPILVVLEWGEASRPIGTYGALGALGIAVACFVVVRAAARAGADVGKTFSGLAIVVWFAGLGAWLTFGLVEWARTGDPAPMWEGGGVVFFGSIPGGALGLWIARRWLGLDVIRLLELSLPGLAAGHALGRLGCFFGGCCYGRAFDGAWAVTYLDAIAPAAHPSFARHPSPLYEAVGLLVIGMAFALIPARRPGDGRRAAAYLIFYSLLRGTVELTRGDAIRGVFVGGLSTSQMIAAIGLVAAAAFLAIREKSRSDWTRPPP